MLGPLVVRNRPRPRMWHPCSRRLPIFCEFPEEPMETLVRSPRISVRNCRMLRGTRLDGLRRSSGKLRKRSIFQCRGFFPARRIVAHHGRPRPSAWIFQMFLSFRAHFSLRTRRRLKFKAPLTFLSAAFILSHLQVWTTSWHQVGLLLPLNLVCFRWIRPRHLRNSQPPICAALQRMLLATRLSSRDGFCSWEVSKSRCHRPPTTRYLASQAVLFALQLFVQTGMCRCRIGAPWSLLLRKPSSSSLVHPVRISLRSGGEFGMARIGGDARHQPLQILFAFTCELQKLHWSHSSGKAVPPTRPSSLMHSRTRRPAYSRRGLPFRIVWLPKEVGVTKAVAFHHKHIGLVRGRQNLGIRVAETSFSEVWTAVNPGKPCPDKLQIAHKWRLLGAPPQAGAEEVNLFLKKIRVDGKVLRKVGQAWVFGTATELSEFTWAFNGQTVVAEQIPDHKKRQDPVVACVQKPALRPRIETADPHQAQKVDVLQVADPWARALPTKAPPFCWPQQGS